MRIDLKGKEAYEKPRIRSETVEIGVYGEYAIPYYPRRRPYRYEDDA